MPRFADCDIGIKIDGQYLHEYGTQTVDSNVTTWIASDSGKEFQIAFSAEDHPCSLQLIIYVDGLELINRGYDHRKMGKTIICDGISLDANTVKPFIFSDLTPSSDEPMLFNAPEHPDAIGTIRIDVFQVVLTESHDPQYCVPSMCNDPAQRRSIIAGARGICLGEQRRLRTKKMKSMPYDPDNPGPIVTFKFTYRPKSMLIAQGIIPTYIPKIEDPLPVPPAMPLHRDDNSRDEAIRRLRAQQERIRQELKELEDLRRLRERQASIEHELEELEEDFER